MTFLKVLFCSLCLFFISVLYAAPMFVYKASTQPPEFVFQNGLNAESDDENFIQHVTGTLCSNNTDGFVSTSAYHRYVNSLVRNRLINDYIYESLTSSIYIYTIRATNDFYNSQITLDHIAGLNPSPIINMSHLQIARALARRSSEYITPVRIEPELIQEADIYSIDQNLVITTSHQYNRGYVPGSTEANSGPYLGSDTLSPQNLSMPLVAGTLPVTACLLPNIEPNEHFEPFLLYILNNVID